MEPVSRERLPEETPHVVDEHKRLLETKFLLRAQR